ncbi:nucleotide-binding protein [Bradyrhizobium monzae]|uniref:nucleotide-binding protein n=1 Tax=Bradyrhizobium sp. Oc8 TaxID=2876780 RepID=UPI001F46207E|nr:nucleotide-binding protein [Bradyrhizobium sp. Oc8]
MFIGSSSEGFKVARAIAQQLQDQLEITTWSSGLFGLGDGTLESLLEAAPTFDFATLVLTPDDVTTSRASESQSPRDNVIFEAGLFIGVLGRKRAFIVFDADTPIKIPSDLAGITVAQYRGHRSDGNLVAAVDEACHLIRASIERLGPVSRGLLAHAQTGTYALGDPSRIRRTVWFLGSATELDDESVAFLKKFIPELCSRLVSVGCRIVVGDSPMLRQIAVAFRAAMAATEHFIPNPVVMEGSLRNVSADKLFLETIGQIPNLAIAIGGSRARGRVRKEYENAVRANIPILSIKCVGGAASDLDSTVDGAREIDSLGTNLKVIDSGELSRKVAMIVSQLA